MQGACRALGDVCHQQWKDTKVCLSAHDRWLQVLLVGSDPRGAHAEAVTSFPVGMCHEEVSALEEISRRLGPDRSFSLFSSAARGTVLSWQSAKDQHYCPSQAQTAPPVPPQGSGPWGRPCTRNCNWLCCSLGTLEYLQLPRPCGLKSSTLPRTEKLGPAGVRE